MAWKPKIDDDVPPPTVVYEETIEAMNVGDSFLVPEELDSPALLKSFHDLARRRGIKLLSRKVEGGRRLWRKE